MEILGQPCDISGVVEISGRGEERIACLKDRLAMHAGLCRVKLLPTDPPMDNWLEALAGLSHLLDEPKKQWEMNRALFRAIELASTDAEAKGKLHFVGNFIPQNGCPAELAYLAQVVKLCPGG